MEFDALDPTQQSQALETPSPVPFDATQAQSLVDRGLLSPDTFAKLNFNAPVPQDAPPIPMANPEPMPVSAPAPQAMPEPQAIPNAGSQATMLPVDMKMTDGPQPIPLNTMSVNNPVTQAIDDQRNAILDAAKIGEAKGAEQGAAFANADKSIQKQNALSLAKQTEIQQKVDQQMQKVNQLTDSLKSDKIDPDKFWAEKTTGQKILAGISLFLGGFGRNGNDALRIINDSIDRDINSQKMAIAGKKDFLGEQQNMLGLLKGSLKDEQLALQAAKVAALDKASMQANQIAVRYSGQEAAQKANLLVSQLDAQKGAIQQDMMRRVAFTQAMQGENSGGINPEMLDEKQRERFVPGYGLALTNNDAKEMKQAVADVSTAKDGIDRLKAITKITGKSLSPELRAEAATTAQMLQGSLRTLLIGQGAVSEGERALLEKIIVNPTSVISLDDSSKKRLDTLANRLDVTIANKAKASGLRVPKQVKFTKDED